jgi:hypothetical protein
MPDIPDAMLANGRGAVQDFEPMERLFRRIRPGSVDAGEVSIDKIELPDISVNRQKYGDELWVLVPTRDEDDFQGWGWHGCMFVMCRWAFRT